MKDRHEKVETVIKLLEAVDLYVDESLAILHGLLGELDVERDFGKVIRANFKLIKGGKSEKKGKRKKP